MHVMICRLLTKLKIFILLGVMFVCYNIYQHIDYIKLVITTKKNLIHVNFKLTSQGISFFVGNSTPIFITKSANFTKDEDLNQNSSFKTLLYLENLSCQPLYPETLLFNRIFKTGSSSLEEILRRLQTEMNYTCQIFTTEDWYNSGDSAPYPEIIEYFSQKHRRLVFTAHFFFRKHLRINVTHTYVNILRDPIKRIISHYYYMRNAKMRPPDRVRELLKSGEWNESLVQCIEKQHRGCEDNVMTRFLCGASRFCKNGSEEALKAAKYHLRYNYAVVGTTEQFETMLKVLKHRLPSFFGLVTPDILYKKKVNDAPKKNYSVEIYDLIKRRNKADYELFEFARKRLKKQAKACKKTVS